MEEEDCIVKMPSDGCPYTNYFIVVGWRYLAWDKDNNQWRIPWGSSENELIQSRVQSSFLRTRERVCPLEFLVLFGMSIEAGIEMARKRLEWD